MSEGLEIVEPAPMMPATNNTNPLAAIGSVMAEAIDGAAFAVAEFQNPHANSGPRLWGHLQRLSLRQTTLTAGPMPSNVPSGFHQAHLNPNELGLLLATVRPQVANKHGAQAVFEQTGKLLDAFAWTASHTTTLDVGRLAVGDDGRWALQFDEDPAYKKIFEFWMDYVASWENATASGRITTARESRQTSGGANETFAQCLQRAVDTTAEARMRLRAGGATKNEEQAALMLGALVMIYGAGELQFRTSVINSRKLMTKAAAEQPETTGDMVVRSAFDPNVDEYLIDYNTNRTHWHLMQLSPQLVEEAIFSRISGFSPTVADTPNVVGARSVQLDLASLCAANPVVVHTTLAWVGECAERSVSNGGVYVGPGHYDLHFTNQLERPGTSRRARRMTDQMQITTRPVRPTLTGLPDGMSKTHPPLGLPPRPATRIVQGDGPALDAPFETERVGRRRPDGRYDYGPPDAPVGQRPHLPIGELPNGLPNVRTPGAPQPTPLPDTTLIGVAVNQPDETATALLAAQQDARRMSDAMDADDVTIIWQERVTDEDPPHLPDMMDATPAERPGTVEHITPSVARTTDSSQKGPPTEPHGIGF